MNIGDLVIVHIERNVQGNQTITRWVQEVLAVNPVGDVTHTCAVGKSAETVPSKENSLKGQHIVETEPMNKYEQEVARYFFEGGLLSGPLDESMSKDSTITILDCIKAFAAHKESPGSLD